jgi:TetR/AcrR family transcriptional regulator, transcriptional repressor for nem operon
VPRDGTATKQRILETAERLVIDNGFAATSVDEVIAASKTSKGAFFHHFDSKLDLARSLVARYAASDIEQLKRAVAEAQATTDDPAERVIAFVRVFERAADELMSAQSGCLFVSLLTERQLVQSVTSAHIREAIVAWRTDFSAMLHEAVQQPRRVEHIDIDALADHLFVTFERSFILCRAMSDNRHMRAQLTILRQLVQALLTTASNETADGHHERSRAAAPPRT